MKASVPAAEIESIDLDKAVVEEAFRVLQEHLPKWKLRGFIEAAILNQIEIVKLCGGGQGLDGRDLRPTVPVAFGNGQEWPATGSRSTSKILHLVPRTAPDAKETFERDVMLGPARVGFEYALDFADCLLQSRCQLPSKDR